MIHTPKGTNTAPLNSYKEGDSGEKHDPETHLIPLILDVAAGRSRAIKVFGGDYETEDGSCIRDYIHVTDLAKAHVLALKRLSTQSESAFINLGTNRGYSVLEIVKKTEQITGKTVHYTAKPRRKGDPPILLASKEKAERLLDWQLAHSDIETIIQTAWNWHSKQ